MRGEPPNTLSVLVADDSAIVRERLAGLLTERAGLEVVGQAASAGEAWTLFQRQQPAAVVLDVSLQGGSALDLVRRIKQARPGCVVMVLTNHHNAEFQKECRRHGADFFLHKATEFEQAADVLGELLHEGWGQTSKRTGAGLDPKDFDAPRPTDVATAIPVAASFGAPLPAVQARMP